MTPAPAGPPSEVFSLFSIQAPRHDRTRRDAILLSLAVQALLVALLACLKPYVVPDLDRVKRFPADLAGRLPVVFRGIGGGGGGGRELLPANQGVLPRSSLDVQLAPPTVMRPTEMPREPTVTLAPEITLQSGQVGDPMAAVSKILSNGPAGPNGIGTGCCGGVGPGNDTGVGLGPGGHHLAGAGGVTVPRILYGPEPSFSEEARKSKTQGVVRLLLVVGADGLAHNIRVQSSLGMGLDEKAVEAVKNWRFAPALFKDQPVETEVEIEVYFHLY